MFSLLQTTASGYLSKTSKKHQLIKPGGKCPGSPQLLAGAEDVCAVQTPTPQHYQTGLWSGSKISSCRLNGYCLLHFIGEDNKSY